MTRAVLTWLAAVLAFACFGSSYASEVGQERSDDVTIDMTRWYRRDWQKCRSATTMQFVDGAVHIVSEKSGGLFWQIPLLQGTPMDLDRDENRWLDECKRPPVSFNKEIERRGFDDLLDMGEHRQITWRWKVDHSTVDDANLVDDKGKVEKEYDDFPAMIGISMLKKGSDTVREIAYVWTRSLPESTILTAETTVIPLIWKMKWRRIVAESGTENFGRWVRESHDLYEDYRRGYPGEEPGKILRIYLMTDTDNTKSRSSAWYADIVFHRHPPEPAPAATNSNRPADHSE